MSSGAWYTSCVQGMRCETVSLADPRVPLQSGCVPIDLFSHSYRKPERRRAVSSPWLKPEVSTRATLDEVGKLFAGTLQERAQLGLSLCRWLLPLATKFVMAGMTVEEARSLMPAKEAGTGPVAPIKPSSNVFVKVTNHLLSPPLLFSFITIYRYLYIPTIDISLLFPNVRRIVCSQGDFPISLTRKSVRQMGTKQTRE